MFFIYFCLFFHGIRHLFLPPYLKDVDPGVPSNKGHVADELTDSFKLLGCILLALLTLSSRIISPRLSSGTKKETTCLW